MVHRLTEILAKLDPPSLYLGMISLASIGSVLGIVAAISTIAYNVYKYLKDSKK